MKKKIARRIVLILLPGLIFFMTQCSKDNNAIPNVYVDFYVYLNQPQYTSLNAVGNWLYLTGGVKGIILYRRSTTEFAAYERSCPYDPNASNAIIVVDSSNIISIDRNCGSKFNLVDNSILNGPSTRSMKMYYADFDVSLNRVHVHS